MNRPIRPIALAILTACMAYPGITMLYQGLYPFWAGDYFNLVGQTGPWMALAVKMGLPPIAVLGAKALIGWRGSPACRAVGRRRARAAAGDAGRGRLAALPRRPDGDGARWR
jgi:hypothetical protein